MTEESLMNKIMAVQIIKLTRIVRRLERRIAVLEAKNALVKRVND